MSNLDHSSTLQVNRFAQRNRHLRVFSRSNLWRIRLAYFFNLVLAPIVALGKTAPLAKVGHFFDYAKHIWPVSPQKRLLTQALSIAGIALITTSVSSAGHFMPSAKTFSNEYIAAYSIPGDILVADEDGYLVKINPQTEDSNRVGLTDYAVHVVESGETLSVIAAGYGVKVETIMWENGIGNANSLRSGQTLLIPPVDGVTYKVVAGDNLAKIADKYKISVDSIIAQNSLESETIQKGESLFLPNAKPLYSSTVASARNSSVYTNSRTTVNADPSTDAPAVGKIFIFPTKGSVSQGYKTSHYALDIADRSQPPIWAAGSGTITKASSGTWGGGYGTHVIIDHGDGVQTLYAHMSTLNVSEGDWVDQGDVVGIMGNTGRVYGATGIHLHWEVIIDGVKQNPYSYF